MKTFRLVGMAITAFLMCVNFTSCKDDEPEGGNDGGIKGKKLVRIENQNSYGDTSSEVYEYDNDNRICSISYKYGNQEDRIDKSRFEYTTSSIEEIIDETGKLDVKYILDTNVKNRISKLENPYGMDGNVILSYDKNNNLIEAKSISENPDYDGDYSKLTWNNGNIVKFTNDYNETYDITYTDKENKSLSPFQYSIFKDTEFDAYLFYIHPELAGIQIKNLIDKVTCTYSDGDRVETETYNYSYEFDKDGYVVRIKEINSDSEGKFERDIRLYWE